MSASEMRSLRFAIAATQADMAKLMGFSFRGYQDLESGRASFAPRHRHVLERVSLSLAVARCDPSLALSAVRADAAKLSSLVLVRDQAALEVLSVAGADFKWANCDVAAAVNHSPQRRRRSTALKSGGRNVLHAIGSEATLSRSGAAC